MCCNSDVAFPQRSPVDSPGRPSLPGSEWSRLTWNLWISVLPRPGGKLVYPDAWHTVVNSGVETWVCSEGEEDHVTWYMINTPVVLSTWAAGLHSVSRHQCDWLCTGCHCSDFKAAGRLLPRARAAAPAPAGVRILGRLSLGAWWLARFVHSHRVSAGVLTVAGRRGRTSTLWWPLLPCGYSYKASSARLG